MLNIALEFLAFFFFILIAGYILPAGQFYLLYHKREGRIQGEPKLRPGQIRREVRMSMVTIAIFAIGSTILLELYFAGKTMIYWDRQEYFLGYGVLSVLICLVLLDTWFYWTHRLMHLPALFKYTHAGHHKSVTPTPWSIFAFQPAEAVIQFLGVALLVVFVPLHPIALFVFLSIDTVVNTAGHCGYEVVPRWLSRRPLLQFCSTVTSHDNHHTNMRVNFSSFFNVWDRICGTYQSDIAPDSDKHGR